MSLKKTIIMIPGLGTDMSNWKISPNKKDNIYDFLIHNTTLCVKFFIITLSLKSV